jgi:hypothetical protein
VFFFVSHEGLFALFICLFLLFKILYFSVCFPIYFSSQQEGNRGVETPNLAYGTIGQIWHLRLAQLTKVKKRLRQLTIICANPIIRTPELQL